MGLDIVELVLEIEDEFDIHLPDSDMEVIRTPYDLATYIYEKLSNPENDKCRSQVGFYKLRKKFMDGFGLKKEELSPDTNLQELLGEDIRSKWKQLVETLEYGQHIPSLILDKKYIFPIFILAFILSISTYLFYNIDIIEVIPIFIFIFIFVFLLSTVLFANIIPDKHSKLSSLIKYTGTFSGYSGNYYRYNSKEKILKRVIEISSYQLNVSIDDIKPNSRYVEDLGAC